MNCELCRTQLSLYLEGELQPNEKEAVTAHLASCSHCSAELSAMKEMIADLKTVPQPPVPSDFRQKIWATIEAPAPLSRLRDWFVESWYFKLPIGAIATAAVALLVVQVTKVTSPELMSMHRSADESTQTKVGTYYNSKKETLDREQTPPESLNGAAMARLEKRRSAPERKERLKTQQLMEKPSAEPHVFSTSTTEAVTKIQGQPTPPAAPGISVAGSRSVPQELPPSTPSTESFQKGGIPQYAYTVVTLTVAGLPPNKRKVEKIITDMGLTEFETRKVINPRYARYYLAMTEEQRNSFLELLQGIGRMQMAQSKSRGADTQSILKEIPLREERIFSHWVILDLVAEPAVPNPSN